MLLLIDRVDEWMLSHLYEFEGMPLQSVAKGAVDLGKLQDEDEKKQADAAAEQCKPMLERLKAALKDRAKDVRVTTRLVDSPACLVVEEGDMSAHLARLLKQAGQEAPKAKPILEVNPQHALVKRLQSDSAPLRRSGAHRVRPGVAGRRRPARGPGRLRAARDAAVVGARRAERVGYGASGPACIASTCSRNCCVCCDQ